MQPKTVSFVAKLIPDTRRRHTHVRLKNDIISFVVQLEVLVKDKWFSIVRYDTAHGFAHKHLFHYREEPEQMALFTDNYAEALDFADADIKSNWEFYRERFLMEVKNDCHDFC